MSTPQSTNGVFRQLEHNGESIWVHASLPVFIVRYDAIEHAKQCHESSDGWEVETLGHNIESNFPELEPEQCDDIAAAVLKARS